MLKFSVLICVYGKDNAGHFDCALDSIAKQTKLPDEVVLVVDGPISAEIQNVIDKYKGIFQNFITEYLPENKGLGIARRVGTAMCSHELIAMMDADDIAVKDRFEKQLQCFEEDFALSVCGGYIYEFIDNVENVVGVREVPLCNQEIKIFMKKRCPFNHVTAMIKKSELEKSGGYLDWYYNEDYYLWLRMYLQGSKFQNIPQNLVYVRVGSDMYARRGGIKYFRSEKKLQQYMLKHKIIGHYTYFVNIVKRFIVQVILPNKIRAFVFQKFAREKVNFEDVK